VGPLTVPVDPKDGVAEVGLADTGLESFKGVDVVVEIVDGLLTTAWFGSCVTARWQSRVTVRISRNSSCKISVQI
jgi:hypothetical protein